MIPKNWCTLPYEVNHSDKMDWDQSFKGLVLSSFSYGYMSTQIIGGRLTELYGVKKIFGISLFLTAIGTVLSPVVVKWNSVAFIVLRVFQVSI